MSKGTLGNPDLDGEGIAANSTWHGLILIVGVGVLFSFLALLLMLFKLHRGSESGTVR
jgi:hypothetical protein